MQQECRKTLETGGNNSYYADIAMMLFVCRRCFLVDEFKGQLRKSYISYVPTRESIYENSREIRVSMGTLQYRLDRLAKETNFKPKVMKVTQDIVFLQQGYRLPVMQVVIHFVFSLKTLMSCLTSHLFGQTNSMLHV
jgi:hypothetical protein